MESETSLISRLPKLHGRIGPGSPLSAVTWFAVGGSAEVMVRPDDIDDLVTFLRGLPADVPLLTIGVGSNLLVRDGGIEGVVLRLGREFAKISVEGETVRAGAGALDLNVSMVAQDAELAGLEFLRGIPGTIGGAVVMNAGAYEREISDVLVLVTILERDGRLRTMTPDECGFSYRHSNLPPGAVVVEAVLRGRPGDWSDISARMEAIKASRATTQPLRSRTGGSTFKNPTGFKAWELIERAGCRGLRYGDAVVSSLHCNFLINEGGARAADLEGLGEEVRRRVFENAGILLEWEIVRYGRFAASLKEGGEA